MTFGSKLVTLTVKNLPAEVSWPEAAPPGRLLARAAAESAGLGLRGGQREMLTEGTPRAVVSGSEKWPVQGRRQDLEPQGPRDRSGTREHRQRGLSGGKSTSSSGPATASAGLTGEREGVGGAGTISRPPELRLGQIRFLFHFCH